MEARVGLYAAQIQGDHRDLGHAGLFKCPADKADIIGGPAASPGLGHDNGWFV